MDALNAEVSAHERMVSTESGKELGSHTCFFDLSEALQ